MQHNIYTEKYKIASNVAENRASISACACERIISLISKAQGELNNNKSWRSSLAKVFKECSILINTIEDSDFGEWGQGVIKFYLQVVVSVNKIILDELEPSVLNEIRLAMLDAKNCWQDLDKKFLEENYYKTSSDFI
ncbi:MAG UNVERIFIED_CONTAM: hypothetical protein LVQ98_05240 [Rickettsiaceae bacterium]